MDFAKDALAGLRVVPLPSTGVLSLLPLLVLALLFRNLRSASNDPWSLPSWKGIPLIGNTIQYIMDNGSFISRASFAMQTRDIVKFYMGPMKVYLVTGPQNVQAMFRKSTSLSSDKFLLMVMGTVMCFTKEDYTKFSNDKTGRLPEPMEGTAAAHKGPRYWAGFHHNFARNLSQISATTALTAKYYEFFQEVIQVYPVGEWTTVNLFQFMRTRMAAAAIKAMTGEKLLGRTGEEALLDAMWDYDSISMRLIYSLPKWIDPEPWRIRDRFHRMGIEWLQSDFDPVLLDNIPDVDWHPVLGLRFIREYLKWGKQIGLSTETRAGYFIGFLLGLNANSIPSATWALFELVKDPSLWKAIREEAELAFETDPATGERELNIQKVLALPLLQSVYAETLRLHVSVNVTREVIAETTTMAGYQLPKHALVQAPSRIAHYDEKVWGVDDHPASEFWASRNIKYSTVEENGKEKQKPKFVMRAGPNEYFPYGGGISMCPGRHFAKQEIMSTLAFIVTTFDVEMVEWVSIDGKTKSDRPAQDNLKYSGSAAMPPDRDLKIRWRRRL